MRGVTMDNTRDMSRSAPDLNGADGAARAQRGGNRPEAPTKMRGAKTLHWLSQPWWEGIGTLVSILTLAVTVVLTMYVARWTESQNSARLFIHSPKWTVSTDQRRWQVEIVIDNDGPITASDLTIGTKVADTPWVTMTELTVVSENEFVGLRDALREETVPWRIATSATIQTANQRTMEPVDVDVRNYGGSIEELRVGRQLVVRASFDADPELGLRFARVFHCEGHWMCEQLNEPLEISFLRAFLVHNLDVRGNKVIATKSAAWSSRPAVPVAIR